MMFTIFYLCRFEPGKWYEQDAGSDRDAACKEAYAIHARRGTSTRVEDADGNVIAKFPGD